MRPFVALAFLGMAVVAAPSVQAQATPIQSRASGFYLGLGLEGNGIVTSPSGSASTSESGAGAGLVLGYGFNRTWSLYGDVSDASINAADGSGNYSLAHVDLGTRVHFRAGPNTVVPFLQFGVSGRGESQNVTDANGVSHSVSASGAGVFLGGGAEFHFTPAMAFSAAATWSFGNFSNYQIDNQSVSGESVSATSARVHLGLVWFPGA